MTDNCQTKYICDCKNCEEKFNRGLSVSWDNVEFCSVECKQRYMNNKYN